MRRNKSRKMAVSLSMSPEVMEVVDRIGHGNSFSAKLEWIVHELKRRAEALVHYDNEQQWESGEPTLLWPTARRIYSVAPFGTGAEHVEEYEVACNALALALGTGKKKTLDVGKVTNELQALGYAVQVVQDAEHDVLDVWVAKGDSDDVLCKGCSKLNRGIEAMRKEMLQ